MQNRKSYIGYFLIGVFVVGGLFYVAAPFLSKERRKIVADAPTTTAPSMPAPATSAPATGIIQEGEVSFWRGDQLLRKIAVEVAENDAEREKGLMFRPHLADSVGMLFIFNQAEPQSFWMKNTAVSLDIIYVGQDKKIVSIQKNAKPYSEEGLPSLGSAQYVVEVVGGYTDKNDIRVGDSISF